MGKKQNELIQITAIFCSWEKNKLNEDINLINKLRKIKSIKDLKKVL